MDTPTETVQKESSDLQMKPKVKLLQPIKRDPVEVANKNQPVWEKKPGTNTKVNSYANSKTWGSIASQGKDDENSESSPVECLEEAIKNETSTGHDDLDDIFATNDSENRDSGSKYFNPEDEDLFDSAGSTSNLNFKQTMSTTHIPGNQNNKKVILKRRDPEAVTKSEQERREKEKRDLERENAPTFVQRESNYAEARAKLFGPEDEENDLDKLTADLSLEQRDSTNPENKPLNITPTRGIKQDSSPRKTNEPDSSFEKLNNYDTNQNPKSPQPNGTNLSATGAKPLFVQSEVSDAHTQNVNANSTNYNQRCPNPQVSEMNPNYRGPRPGKFHNNYSNQKYPGSGYGSNNVSFQEAQNTSGEKDINSPNTGRSLLPTPDEKNEFKSRPRGPRPPYDPNSINPNYKGKAHNYIHNYRPPRYPQTKQLSQTERTRLLSDGGVIQTDPSGMQHYFPPTSAKGKHFSENDGDRQANFKPEYSHSGGNPRFNRPNRGSDDHKHVNGYSSIGNNSNFISGYNKSTYQGSPHLSNNNNHVNQTGTGSSLNQLPSQVKGTSSNPKFKSYNSVNTGSHQQAYQVSQFTSNNSQISKPDFTTTQNQKGQYGQGHVANTVSGTACAGWSGATAQTNFNAVETMPHLLSTMTPGNYGYIDNVIQNSQSIATQTNVGQPIINQSGSGAFPTSVPRAHNPNYRPRHTSYQKNNNINYKNNYPPPNKFNPAYPNHEYSTRPKRANYSQMHGQSQVQHNQQSHGISSQHVTSQHINVNVQPGPGTHQHNVGVQHNNLVSSGFNSQVAHQGQMHGKIQNGYNKTFSTGLNKGYKLGWEQQT